MIPSPVAFVGTRRPLSRRFLTEVTRHCPEVLCLPPCLPGAASLGDRREGRRGLAVPVIVLVTWMDLLCESDDLAASFAADLDAIHAAVPVVGPIIMCLVPYASLAAGDRRLVAFLRRGSGEPYEDHVPNPAIRMADALERAGHDCRVVFAPMLLWPDCDQSTGYVSLAHKAIRVSRCLVDEVRSKVPEYFSRFPLKLRHAEATGLNVASCSGTVTSLLEIASDAALPGCPRARIHLDSQTSWAEFTSALTAALNVRVAHTDSAADSTALDDTFTELVFSDPDIRMAFVCDGAGNEMSRSMPTSGVADIVAGVAVLPPEAWDDSYVVVRAIGCDAIDGLQRRLYQGVSPDDASGTITYSEGGNGPTVVILVPLGIDGAYFSHILQELIRDHHVVMWQARGSAPEMIAEDTACLRDVVSPAGESGFHLVTWCGGVRLAAHIAAECGPQVRSVTLFAPFLNAEENQTRGYRRLVKFYEQIAATHSDAGVLASTAQEYWHDRLANAPSEQLDQYGSRALARSPLQYHPTGFSSPATDALFSDAPRFVRILKLAQADDCASTVQGSRQDLAAYEGPVLVIAGTADHLVNYASVRSRCAEMGRWTLATVLAGNHYTLLEHGPTIGQWLRGLIRDGRLTIGSGDKVTGTRCRLTRPANHP